MKTISLLGLILFSTQIFSQDILCVPDATNAPFDSVELQKIKANKYLLVVKNHDDILLKDEVAYVFLRRNQYGRFRNKAQTITIKTKRLYVDQPQKSLLAIEKLDKASFPGMCKLY